ncbi:uncharacterized protein RSE6_02726 [Rhynchosporium secalis]|uniref:Uncharacterized protein n=1 Tax=Rhynchosporium secalis TaxID=38038 RepID=A0A1E1M120_RHYSE|nr:uncharacterized protein RSE6_02726 [Rhynchosporium secalis]
MGFPAAFCSLTSATKTVQYWDSSLHRHNAPPPVPLDLKADVTSWTSTTLSDTVLPVRKMSKVIGLRRRVCATRNTCMESNDVKKDPPTPAALTWTFSSPQASLNSTNTTYNRSLLRARNMTARIPSN